MTKTKKQGTLIMTQKELPFKYEQEKKEKNLTTLCGLLLYLGLFEALKLDFSVNKNLKVKADRQGYRDDQIILALILLNLAGGESVSDIKLLEKDKGFCQILKTMELRGAIGRRREEIIGRIRFAIGCDITPAFKESILLDKNLEWQPIYKIVKGEKKESGQEWAEVCFVPNEIGRSKRGREYRYIVVREELEQIIGIGSVVVKVRRYTV